MTTTATSKPQVLLVQVGKVLQGDTILDESTLEDRYTVDRITHYWREGVVEFTDTEGVVHAIGVGCPLVVLRSSR